MPDNLSDLLAGLLRDPAALKLLASLAGHADHAQADTPAPPLQAPEAVPPPAPLLPLPEAPPALNDTASRTAGLLAAIRPYVADDRRDRVDSLIQALKLASLLRRRP